MTQTHVRAGSVAGTLLVVAAAVILLGIISAEAVYPAVYTTHDNQISDLGATKPPNSIILQPSARLFDAAMIASGILLIAAAAALRRGLLRRDVPILLGLAGIGVLGVGVFPGNRAPMHALFALLAFSAGGMSAVFSAKVQAAPASYVSATLGVVSLLNLGLGLFGSDLPVWGELGDGGIERWVAYPVVLWFALFGGYLLAAAERKR